MSPRSPKNASLTQAEIEALRERHDIALRAANIGTWTWHVDAGYVEVDPYTEAVFGIEQGSFDGEMESWPKLMHPDDSAAALAAIALCGKNGTPFEVTYRVPQVDGSERWLKTRGEATARDAKDNVLRVAGGTWDVTTEIRAQQQASAALERVEETTKYSGMGMWEIDTASQTVTFDLEWKRRTGIPESAVVDVDYVLAHVVAADAERWSNHLQQALTGNHDINIEFEWCRPDNGQQMQVRARGSAYRNDQGSVTGLRGIIIDETEQQAAREEKAAAQMQIELASRMSGTGFWQFDAAKQMLEFNPDWLAIVGIPESADVSVEYLLQHMDRGDLEKFQHTLGEALQDGGAIDTSFRWTRPQGGEFMVIRARGTVERNADGKITGLRGVAIDETEAYFARQKSEALLTRVEAVSQLGSVGFWEFDAASQCIDFTPEWRRVIGIPESGLLTASDVIALTHEDDRAGWPAAMQKSLTEGAPVIESFRWHNQVSSDLMYLRIFGAPQRDEAGNIIGVVGVVIDETEVYLVRQKSDELLARIREASRTFGIGFWQLDATTLEIEFDQDWLDTVGVPRDTEVSVAYQLNYMVPKDVAGFQRDLEATLKNADDLDTVFGWQRPDNGEVMVVRARGKAQTDAQGNVTSIDGMTIDETEQTRLLAARDASQAKVDQVLDTGLIGFWSLDAETGAFELDRGWLKTVGHDPDVQPQNPQALVEQATHPDDRERLFGAFQTALANGNSFDDEFRYIRADTGELRHCRGYGNPVRDAQGEITGLVGFIVDIEAEARALQDAEKALARVDEAAQGGKLGFWGIDAASGELEVDANWRRLAGWGLQAAKPDLTQALALVVEQDRATLTQLMTDMIANGASLDHEYRFQRVDDGRIVEVRIRGQAQRDAEGNVTRYTGYVSDQTEEAAQRRELDELRRRYDRAMESGGIGSFSIDMKTQAAHIDENLAALLQIKPGDFGGTLTSLIDITVPEDQPLLLNAIEQGVATREEQSFTHRVQLDDGEIRWLKTRGGVHLSEQGEPLEIGGATWDITAEMRARLDVENLHARQNNILRVARVNAWNWAIASDRMEVSAHAAEIFGNVPAAENDGLEAWIGVIHPDDQDVARQALLGCAQGRSFEQRYRVPQLDGNLRWLLTRAEPFEWAADGSVISVGGTTADVSEEMFARAEIEEIRQRYDAALDGVGVTAWGYFPEGQRFVAHDNFTAVVGMAPGSWDGSFAGLMAQAHPDDRDWVTAALMESAEQGTDLDIRYRRFHGDGSIHWIEVRAKAFRNERGTIEHVSGAAWDVTESAELNLALERSNRDLDDFAYIASHDLREPLRGIHNFVGFMAKDYADNLDDTGRDMLATLGELAERLDNLLEDLLNFSRVGRAELAVVETDLNQVVHGVLKTLQFTLNEKGVKIRKPKPLPVIECDRVRIGELFRNLITNAIKYNDKDEKWIEIGFADGKFYVRDNGIGIADHNLDRVFKIFKRLHGRDAYGGGTGAGLTIAKQIAERHGGTLWVESTQGEGSTFYFTLSA